MKLYVYCLALLACFWFTSCSQKTIGTQSNARAYIINGGSRTVDVIDLNKQKVSKTYQLDLGEGYYPHHIYRNSTAQKLVIATPQHDFSKGHDMTHMMTMPGGLAIIDEKTGNIIKSINTSVLNHNAVFSPDGTEIWTALMSHSGKIVVFNATDGTLISEIPVDSDPSELIFSKDGKYALVACGESTFLEVLDVQTKKRVTQIKVDKYPSNVWEGYEDLVIVSNSQKKSINFVDVNKRKVIDFIDLPFMPGFTIYNEKYQELWICAGMKNFVSVYKKNDNGWQEAHRIISKEDPHMIKFFNNNEKAILINQQSNDLHFIDVEKRQIEKTIATGSKPNGIVIATN